MPNLVMHKGEAKATQLHDLKRINSIILQELLNIPPEKRTNQDRDLIIKLTKVIMDCFQQIDQRKKVNQLEKLARLKEKTAQSS